MRVKEGLSGGLDGSSNSSFSGGGGGTSPLIIVGRVTDIILNNHHPKFKDFGEWQSIGTINFQPVGKNDLGIDSKIAKPFFPSIKNYPLINELVLVIYNPSPIQENNTIKNKGYYISGINLWGTPHANPLPDTGVRKNSNKPKIEYNVNVPNLYEYLDESTPLPLNSPNNPTQKTFDEKDNIHPLQSYSGDVIYEGRFGQSIRFGSTVKEIKDNNQNGIFRGKNNTNSLNDWSSSGKSGDPIMIIRNGQSLNIFDKLKRSWIPINEDINKDLSTIYLTSYQKLSEINLSQKFSQFKISPKSPSEYIKPQILLNSDRIILNAKNDSILISGAQSFNVSVGLNVNIDSENLYIDGEITKLGSKTAKEPVLKGDTTVELLKTLTKTVKALAQILSVEKSWNGGVRKDGVNEIANDKIGVLENLLKQLDKKEGEKNSLKSNTTKVK